MAVLMGTPWGSLNEDAGTAISTWIVGERCSSSTSRSMPFFSRASEGRRKAMRRTSLDTGALFLSTTPLKSVGCCGAGASCAATGADARSRIARNRRLFICGPLSVPSARGWRRARRHAGWRCRWRGVHHHAVGGLQVARGDALDVGGADGRNLLGVRVDAIRIVVEHRVVGERRRAAERAFADADG